MGRRLTLADGRNGWKAAISHRIENAMKVAVQNGRIVVSGRRGGAIQIANVADVAAEKVGKITYDELFLIVREHSGDAVAIGELDEGFAEAEQALRSHLPNFPTGWKPTAEASPIGIRVQVWPTS